VSISPVALRKGSRDIDGDPLEGRPDFVLVHQAPNSGSGTSACRTVVALLTPTLNDTLQVLPIVSQSDFIECLVDSEVSLARSSVHFRQHFLQLAAGNDRLSRLGFPISRLPVALPSLMSLHSVRCSASILCSSCPMSSAN
jgi:hypothetical protein